MFKKVAMIAALVAVSGFFNAFADVLKIKEGAPANYVVKKGDTLWDISAIYLNEPWLWPKLWQMNPQVNNPHLIYPGDTLSLTYDAQGRPRLAINDKVKRLSPTIRTTVKDTNAIATLPLSMIRHYLSYNQSLSDEQIAKLPYVLGFNANIKNSVSDHIIYAKGVLEVGESYGVYRKGKPYIDPDTQDVLGYETILVATASAFRSGSAATESQVEEASSLNVLSLKREIKQGDRLLPALEGQSLPAFFVMAAPDFDVSGKIIDAPSNLRELSKWEVVVLNRGAEHKLQAGNMLGIYRDSPTVIDAAKGPVYLEDGNKLQKLLNNVDGQVIKLPKEKVGELMIFKVSDRTSFALVTKTQSPIRVGDSIANL